MTILRDHLVIPPACHLVGLYGNSSGSSHSTIERAVSQ